VPARLQIKIVGAGSTGVAGCQRLPILCANSNCSIPATSRTTASAFRNFADGPGYFARAQLPQRFRIHQVAVRWM